MIARKRRHERSEIIAIVQYSVEPAEQSTFDGVTANISKSGFCLLTTHPLSKNDTIRFGKKISASSERAIVRWIDRSHKYYCKAGLEFI
jgi:hypothetical protein